MNIKAIKQWRLAVMCVFLFTPQFGESGTHFLPPVISGEDKNFNATKFPK